MSLHPKPKILILTSTLPRFSGDPEPGFVLHLAEAMADQFDITLLAPMGAGAKPQEHQRQINLHRYHYAPLSSWETLAYPGGIMPRLRRQPWRWLQVPFLMAGLILAIRRLHKEHQFDLIHCHWLIPQGLGALLALSPKHRPPVIATSHGGDVYTFEHGFRRHLLRWVLQRMAGVTAVSQPLVEIIHKLDGQPAKNIAMIPMGVSIESFSHISTSSAWLKKHGLKVPLILFVGRLAEKKGVCHLLSALDQEVLKTLDFTVAIIGDGPLRGELEQQCRGLSDPGKVHFLGPQSYKQIPLAMATADILVAPSVRAKDGDCEGLPTVILEAMASKLAVVSTPNGGITQVIKDHETGRIVPEANVDALAKALAELLQNTEERRRLAENGFNLVQAFDWQHIAARYTKVLLRPLQD